ncbi:hypothetical protein LAZ40_11080 [Cereibacter sphaeroides]|uniref:hypothetical protein n=1 Tax=Cereibacter sphaeroides TaxID=1063 RepID=UPI001F4119CD|nr:hypothetical protein [Cereibacter sphaeroides]MCE6959599.1 hypothetical protein [Cereibacter sphaeroides]MCE6974541.1 hypothetical protein [Cereibacter sphaeroides]
MPRKVLEFVGAAGAVPDDRADFVRDLLRALAVRGFSVSAEDAHAAWSRYSSQAGFSWVRVPEDTYEVLMRLRSFLRPAADPDPEDASSPPP